MNDETSRKLWAEIRRQGDQINKLEMEKKELQDRFIELTLKVREYEKQLGIENQTPRVSALRRRT
jgi:hypothetical protein